MTQISSIICEIAFWFCGFVFIRREEKKNSFALRMIISAVIALTISAFLGIYYSENFPYANVISQGISAVAVVLFMYCNWKTTWSVVVFNFVWARIVWWLAIETWTFATYTMDKLSGQHAVLGYISLIIIFIITVVLCDMTICRWIPDDGKRKIGPKQLTSAILICVIFEIIAFRPELRSLEGEVGDAVALFLLQWISAIVLYLQNELFRKSSMKEELELVHLLLQKEQEQYRLSKENIAIINQKCHDLKHQIRAIRQVSDEEREQYLQEVEESIRIYESIVQTGNEVLDTILTEKSLYCKERGITISCVADGKLLSFINNMDLYSLFGNAVDNAIEAVEQFEEEEKRQIDVLVYRQQNFLVVNIINPMQETLVLENEMPVTTKRDKNLHGFGVRSMRYIVKKYDGFFNFSQEDGCFSLKFLFPIQ